ncbi:uncharacterized protein [Amphiura filiformis]|uniref:uncharacterized protein n=1 Tax=Amphiura filiformis TaxID=82378 RepID=UPI003B21C56F
MATEEEHAHPLNSVGYISDDHDDRRNSATDSVVSYENLGSDIGYLEPMEDTTSPSALNRIHFSREGYALPNYSRDRVHADVDAVVYGNRQPSTAGAISRPPKRTPRIYDDVAPDLEKKYSNDGRETTPSMISTPDVIPNTPSKIALKPPPKRTAGKPSTAKPVVAVKHGRSTWSRLSTTLTLTAPRLQPGTDRQFKEKPISQLSQQSGGESLRSQLAKALEKRKRHDQHQ